MKEERRNEGSRGGLYLLNEYCTYLSKSVLKELRVCRVGDNEKFILESILFREGRGRSIDVAFEKHASHCVYAVMIELRYTCISTVCC
jgi:hypothetical protein